MEDNGFDYNRTEFFLFLTEGCAVLIPDLSGKPRALPGRLLEAGKRTFRL